MPSGDAHGLGYRRVDGDPNESVLLTTMDATARWEATRQLRAWERAQLQLDGGQRLLDVGCGLGDAARTLAEDLSEAGEVVGIDLSSAMLEVARSRSAGLHCRVRFSEGDAVALDEPDDRYDVVRSERTLQWLADPAAAVTEMARVVRPGGRISLIDSDWSTFAIDVGDDDLATRVRRAMAVERNRPSHVGGRLAALATDAGLAVAAETEAAQAWTRWDPETSPAPEGCFSMQSLAEDLVSAGQLEPSDRTRFVQAIHDAARADRFSMRLTMHAIVADAPG